MYEMTWKTGNGMNVFGHDVRLPDMPGKKSIINYGKKPENQYFVRTGLTIEELSKMHPNEQERAIMGEWHKRIHGEWQYIKGQPVYINGTNWHFLNYWHILDGNVGLPDFYYRNTLVYYLLDHYLRWEEKVMGLVVGKGRRLNLTEISQHIQYERASRKRGFRTLNLNKGEEEVDEDLKRVVHAHQMMAPWFKPISRNDNPQSGGLDFRMPHSMNSRKKLEEQFSDDYEETDSVQALATSINYAASTENKGDGNAYNLIRVSEAFKIDPSKMNIYKHWLALKPTMQKNGKRVGFVIYESTVEEMYGGKTLELAKKMWDLSDISDLKKHKTTKSGLARVFIPSDPYYVVDEYGMPDAEGAKAAIMEAIQAAGDDTRLLLDIRRKYPTKEDDMWTTANNECPFNVVKLVEVMEYLDAGINPDGERVKLPERCDLIWNGDTVRKIVNPNGPFVLLQEPVEESKFLYSPSGKKMPANKHLYSIGIDPYNSTVIEGRKSDGAAVVFRKFDMLVDGENPHSYRMQTNIPVCVYAHRRENPNDFYDDMIKLAVYYGSEVLYERTRSGLDVHFETKGYGYYTMLRPDHLGGGARREAPGVPATTKIIEQYLEAIKGYIEDYAHGIRFMELLKQLTTFTNTAKGRTTHDIVVAFGFALVAAQKRYAAPVQRETKTPFVRAYNRQGKLIS